MKDSFHFLREEEPNVFVECFGIDFEDFEIGDIFEHRPGHTFTKEEAIRHASRALDQSPHFVDQAYSSAVNNGRTPVPEAYVLSTMALSTKTFGKVVANLSMTDFSVEPVFAGDTIYYESKILDKRESSSRPDQGIMHVETRGKNQNDEWVVYFQRKFLVYRCGMGPYASAGY